MAKLRITDGKGVQFNFENGWTVSVQFGKYNYCSDYPKRTSEPIPAGDIESPNAEIAIWDADNNWLSFESDDVRGWVAPDEIADVLKFVRDIPKDSTAKEIKNPFAKELA